jgi:hypothetical protein
LHSTKWSIGRRKRDGNHSLPKNNLIQNSEGNEENRYSVPDSNKTKINNTKESNDAHKNNLKEEILQVITENFMDMLLDMVKTKHTISTHKNSRHQKQRIQEDTEPNK